MLPDESYPGERGIMLSGAVVSTSGSDADTSVTESAGPLRRSSRAPRLFPSALATEPDAVRPSFAPSTGLILRETWSCNSRLGAAQPAAKIWKMASQRHTGRECIRRDPQSLAVHARTTGLQLLSFGCIDFIGHS